MGTLGIDLHLGSAYTTVPYLDFVPVTVNGTAGVVPVSGKKNRLGFGGELDGHWAYAQLSQWFRLTAGANGGVVVGELHSAVVASFFAGIRLTPSPTYYMNIDAGYGLLKVYPGLGEVPIAHGALFAFGFVTALPQLFKGFQIGGRVEVTASEALSQGRGFVTLGYQSIGDDAAVSPPADPGSITPNPKSPVETQLEDVEDRIDMIRSVFHKNLKACLATTEEIGHFLAWTRGNSDLTECRLPLLQPELKKIEKDLAVIRVASTENQELQPRIDAALTALQTTTSFLAHKGMELLVGSQEDSRLSRITKFGKRILTAIEQNNQKGVRAAFIRYQEALNTLQKIFNENALVIGRDNADVYKAPQQAVNCLLTELSCPSTVATEITVPALGKRLGVGK